MNWMEHYTNKRISELKQQIIRNRWHTVELEKVPSERYVSFRWCFVCYNPRYSLGKIAFMSDTE